MDLLLIVNSMPFFYYYTEIFSGNTVTWYLMVNWAEGTQGVSNITEGAAVIAQMSNIFPLINVLFISSKQFTL